VLLCPSPQVLKPESTTAQRLHSSMKRMSGSSASNVSTSQHLQVPGPARRVLRPREAAANMAFDFSSEQLYKVREHFLCFWF
jgi:hypothetical protein